MLIFAEPAICHNSTIFWTFPSRGASCSSIPILSKVQRWLHILRLYQSQSLNLMLFSRRDVTKNGLLQKYYVRNCSFYFSSKIFMMYICRFLRRVLEIIWLRLFRSFLWFEQLVPIRYFRVSVKYICCFSLKYDFDCSIIFILSFVRLRKNV